MSIAVLTADVGPRDVLKGALVLPLRGVWAARLELDADEPITGAVELVLARDDGGPATRFKGTVVLGATDQGRARLIVAGGAGRLAGPTAPLLGPRNYIAPRLSAVVSDLAVDAGEVLAQGVEAALLGTTLPRWLRARGNAADGLQTLRKRKRIEGWRVLPDGTLWAGTETWPEASAEGLYEMGDDGHALVLEVAPESATLAPGSVVLGKRIHQVVYAVGEGLRAALHYSEAA